MWLLGIASLHNLVTNWTFTVRFGRTFAVWFGPNEGTFFCKLLSFSSLHDCFVWKISRHFTCRLYLIFILICFYRPDFISNQVSLFKSISSGNNEMYLNYNDKHVKVKYSPNQNNGAISDAFSTFGLVQFCSGNFNWLVLFGLGRTVNK